VERGSSSLQTLLSLVAFHVVPALLDIVLCGVMLVYSGHAPLARLTVGRHEALSY
jgi:ABC-type transport system involved in Fe-S cluster assembly fused permease/ATPase subunit